jgi:hypothetical protein
MWFFSISTYSYFLIPKTICVKIKCFSQNSHLWVVLNYINMIQNQIKIQNSNLQCSMTSPYLKCLVHPKQYNQPTPLTLPPFYFGFYPRDPCEMKENEMKVVYNLLNIWLFHYSLRNVNLYVNQWFCT